MFWAASMFQATLSSVVWILGLDCSCFRPRIGGWIKFRRFEAVDPRGSIWEDTPLNHTAGASQVLFGLEISSRQAAGGGLLAQRRCACGGSLRASAPQRRARCPGFLFTRNTTLKHPFPDPNPCHDFL